MVKITPLPQKEKRSKDKTIYIKEKRL